MEHKYNASFDLYGPAGVKVRFSLAEDEASVHLAQLDAYLGTLLGTGYGVNPAGTEPGEEVESIGGWVLGETTKDEHCLFLYGTHPGLQFRVTTVFVERMGEMPFKVTPNAKVFVGAAPTRDLAEKKGYFNACPEFKIVMKPTGKLTDEGKPIKKFDRVYGMAAPVAASVPPEVDMRTPPVEKPDVKVGRWTGKAAYSALVGSDPIQLLGPEDATNFGVACGVYENTAASAAAYAAVKARVKPKTKDEMMEAWIENLVGLKMDKETWAG